MSTDRSHPTSPSPSALALAGPAWDALIRQHQHRVVLSLLAMGLPFARATDLAHAAWARLVENHSAGKLPVLKLPGLAIAQARFLAWEERRRDAAVRRAGDVIVGDIEAELVDGRADPEQRLLDQEQARRALAVVAACPPSTQKLFRLLYGDPGLSQAQAATELGLSLERVRHIVCELRKRVRATLDGGEA